jgi:hypothetical protein
MCSNFRKMDLDDDDLTLIAEVERIETEYSRKDKVTFRPQLEQRKVVLVDVTNSFKPPASRDKLCAESDSSGNILDWFKPIANHGENTKQRTVVTEPFSNTSIAILITPSVPELRKYQRDIIITSVMHNTLVCLPTGLGKTLIAAVVMYNFMRWFPDKCVVFMAPTRPLVNQQWQASTTRRLLQCRPVRTSFLIPRQ